MSGEALLIIDMSNDFVADEGSLTAGAKAQDVVPYIVKLADTMISDGNIVAVCMDTHQADDTHFEEWPKHNVDGTWGHQLYGDLASWFDAHKGDPKVKIVPKASYNAFYNTGLGDLLRQAGVEKVHIVGVCTDICDFLTASGAYDEGFKTVAHRRGCATFTENHDVFLTQMKLCFHTDIVE